MAIDPVLGRCSVSASLQWTIVSAVGFSLGTEYPYVGSKHGAIRYTHKIARDASPRHEVVLYKHHALFGLADKPTLKLRGTKGAAA